MRSEQDETARGKHLSHSRSFCIEIFLGSTAESVRERTFDERWSLLFGASAQRSSECCLRAVCGKFRDAAEVKERGESFRGRKAIWCGMRYNPSYDMTGTLDLGVFGKAIEDDGAIEEEERRRSKNISNSNWA